MTVQDYKFLLTALNKSWNIAQSYGLWHKRYMEILNQKALLRSKSEACDGNAPFRAGTQLEEAF